MKKKILLLFVCASCFVLAQNNLPFYNDIQTFKKNDALKMPPKKAILFVGSSSFTYWKDAQSYFPKYEIINRGFGGSTLLDLTRYANDIILPYKAKQIVIYCGENDIASSSIITGDTVYNRFVNLFKTIRKKQPNTYITYISMKPSPLRWSMKEKMMQGNKMIKSFLSTQKKASYINVWDAMLDTKSKPKPFIFNSDSLHMNTKGYTIWQNLIVNHLIK